MAKAKDPASAPADIEKPAGVIVSVMAPGGPRRRAGLEFGKIAVPIALDEISQEQFDAILADPMLTVRPTKDVEPVEAS